jgi:acyl-CoA thioester hydrolase
MVHKRFILFAMTSVSSSGVTSIVEFRVRYAETDQMKVVHHRNYLVWCELGRTDLIRMLGASYAEIEKQGILLAVVEANLRYHAPARYDDRIRVKTIVREARSRSVTFEYTIENADTGEKLVTARTMLASINGEGKLVSMPEQMRRSLEAAVA